MLSIMRMVDIYFFGWKSLLYCIRLLFYFIQKCVGKIGSLASIYGVFIQIFFFTPKNGVLSEIDRNGFVRFYSFILIYFTLDRIQFVIQI